MKKDVAERSTEVGCESTGRATAAAYLASADAQEKKERKRAHMQRAPLTLSLPTSKIAQSANIFS